MWYCTFPTELFDHVFENLFSLRDLNPRGRSWITNDHSIAFDKKFGKKSVKLPTDSFDTNFLFFKCKWICVVYEGTKDGNCLNNALKKEQACDVSRSSPVCWTGKQDSLGGAFWWSVGHPKGRCLHKSFRLPESSRHLIYGLSLDERRSVGRIFPKLEQASSCSATLVALDFWILCKSAFLV